MLQSKFSHRLVKPTPPPPPLADSATKRYSKSVRETWSEKAREFEREREKEGDRE